MVEVGPQTKVQFGRPGTDIWAFTYVAGEWDHALTELIGDTALSLEAEAQAIRYGYNVGIAYRYDCAYFAVNLVIAEAQHQWTERGMTPDQVTYWRGYLMPLWQRLTWLFVSTMYNKKGLAAIEAFVSSALRWTTDAAGFAIGTVTRSAESFFIGIFTGLMSGAPALGPAIAVVAAGGLAGLAGGLLAIGAG